VVGVGELTGGEGIGDGDGGHPGGERGLDASGGVLDDAAAGRADLEEFGRPQEDVGRGFAPRYVLDAHDNLEERP